jgi:hypothetical protein
MGRTACTEPQCLYKCALYLYTRVCLKTLIVVKRGLFLAWNPPLLCQFDINITRQKLYVTFLLTAVKHLHITEGVHSESALRVTLQYVKKVNPCSVFLPSNFEFVAIQTTVLWDETPCNLVDIYQLFGGPTFRHIHGR